MPALNFGTPLYTFDSNHTSHTTTKDCYLYVGFLKGNPVTIAIDGTTIVNVSAAAQTSDNNKTAFTGVLALKSGSTVVVSGADPALACVLVVDAY